jgi:antitoxin HicB
MNKKDFASKLATIQEATPDAVDEKMIAASAAINDGSSVPIDIIKDELDGYNGRILVRIPRSLHRQLAINAKREGVSLNQYALYKLSH